MYFLKYKGNDSFYLKTTFLYFAKTGDGELRAHFDLKIRYENVMSYTLSNKNIYETRTPRFGVVFTSYLKHK